MFGAAALLAVLAAPGRLPGQTPGPSVNMVSGVTLPGGDPFLQRQNEPSLAVSTRNPQHLLAGANDYRTVDLPGLPEDEETGDSWVGLFASLDGGQTWRSTLVPGYPQDTSPPGLASPLKGLTAAADPVVRAGTHGLFYYGLMAFDRDGNAGRLAVARFVDLNDRENGDVASGAGPIRYAGTSIVDSGNSGQFVDKPWLAVDVPRAEAGTCFIPTSPSQTVPAGVVYMAWARFTGQRSTKVMLSRSLDCGATWSHPTKLSESYSINQGLTMAIDPATGEVYVAWRVLAASREPDAIAFTRSDDFGAHFAKAKTLVNADGTTFTPFDQNPDPAQAPYRTAFRTTAYPALAVSVDGSGQSRVHVAWAQRTGPHGDSRIVLSTSSDGGDTWSVPRPVDAGPLEDDFGGSFDRGHQFMPQMASRAGRLMILYYDTRLDHTRGVLTPGPGLEDPSGVGALYRERRETQGELEVPGGSAGADLVFTPFVDDNQPPLEERRHTIDVRVAQLDLRQVVDFGAPRFASARVSQYPFGIASPEGSDDAGDVLTPPARLEQLKFNPPNLPLFAKGTTPFVGDYIDIAGLDFVQDTAGSWRFNTEGAPAPVFHAAWTSNEDVRPPPDGDWTSYTPPGEPGCIPGREGMRNQNVYTGRITQGLVVSSPQTAKALRPYVADDPASVRTFVVQVQNLTGESRSFRLRIAGQPVGGQASFLPLGGGDPPSQTRDTLIPPGSGGSYTVFATSTDPAARIRIEVAEIAGPGEDLSPGGLTSLLVLNADPTTPLLQTLDGGTPAGASETYTPSISNPSISYPSISYPSILNPSILNPSISNPSISNPSILNPSILNPSISNPSISNPSISNPSISNVTIGNPSISNPSIANESVAATPVFDASYAVTNTGNTSSSYRLKLVGDASAVRGPLRLMVSKVQRSPSSVGCALVENARSTVLVDVVDPLVEPPDAETPADDPGAESPTFALRPGETAYVTLRAQPDPDGEDEIVGAVAPVVIPQASESSQAAPLVMLSGSSLPAGRYGVEYSVDLKAFGGKKPYSWTGSLPPGLALSRRDDKGGISGVPLAVGDYRVPVRVHDEGSPPAGVVRILTLRIGRARAAVEAEVPAVVHVGERLPVSVSVHPEGEGTPSGSVAVGEPGGESCAASAPAGTCTLAFMKAGRRTIGVTYEGDERFEGVSATAPPVEVLPAATSTRVTASPERSVSGQAVTVTATVSARPPGSGTPTGAVDILDGGRSLGGPVPLVNGVASLVLSDIAAGPHVIRAVYSGDGNYESSSDELSQQVDSPRSVVTVALSPGSPMVGEAVTARVTVSVEPPGTGEPTGPVTVEADDGTRCSAHAPEGECILLFSSAGTKTVVATYAADEAVSAASATTTLTVEPSLATSDPPTTSDSPVTSEP